MLTCRCRKRDLKIPPAPAFEAEERGGGRMRFKPESILRVVCLLLFLIPTTLMARVTEVIITGTESPAFSGAHFGKVGQYEKLTGVMKCEMDPGNPLNAVIVNIDKAPRNGKGLVEYDVDFMIYKPLDMKLGNGKILYDTINRGNPVVFRIFNAGAPGNGFLMEEGYTIVASGWQAPYPVSGIPQVLVGLGSRLPVETPVLKARLPIARNSDGSPVTGMSRELYYNTILNIPDADGAFIKYLTYPAATLDKNRARLTVRANERDTPAAVPDWRYIDEWRITFKKPAGYDAGALYEFTFPAKDPVVYGLGFAGIRDVVSFLRYAGTDDKGNRNPLGVSGKSQGYIPIEKALAFGVSQTGRLIKTFVVEGFNEDENGKAVFDGIQTLVGGSRKNWLNGQFSHPGDIFGNDQFPFTYAESTDHFTGRSGSNLARCRISDTCPKIMHIDTESEIWESAASLVMTNTEGTNDIILPENVRAYLITGAKHGSGGDIDPGIGQQLTNPLDYSPLLRALLVALEQWVKDNTAPPPSSFPKISDKTLVSPEKLNFPNIPSSDYVDYHLPPADFNGLHLGAFRLDYGTQPPTVLGEYKVYVMDVDLDGNGVGGIRLPDIQVPIGTYTGWNRENSAKAGGDDRLCAATGSFFPFKKTRAERLASGDPRLSIEERYSSHEDYVKKVTHAAQKLLNERLLLQKDVQAIIEKAAGSSIRK